MSDEKNEKREEKKEEINHPAHYNFGRLEVIDVIEDWQLGYRLGNAVKYIARAEHKGTPLKDLEKARWYLDREISARKRLPETTARACPGCGTQNNISIRRNCRGCGVALADTQLLPRRPCSAWKGGSGVCGTCGVPAINHPGAPQPLERGCKVFVGEPTDGATLPCSFCGLPRCWHQENARVTSTPGSCGVGCCPVRGVLDPLGALVCECACHGEATSRRSARETRISEARMPLVLCGEKQPGSGGCGACSLLHGHASPHLWDRCTWHQGDQRCRRAAQHEAEHDYTMPVALPAFAKADATEEWDHTGNFGPYPNRCGWFNGHAQCRLQRDHVGAHERDERAAVVGDAPRVGVCPRCHRGNLVYRPSTDSTLCDNTDCLAGFAGRTDGAPRCRRCNCMMTVSAHERAASYPHEPLARQPPFAGTCVNCPITEDNGGKLGA